MKSSTNQAGGSNKQFSVPLSLDVYDVGAMTGAHRGLLRRLDNRERVRFALYFNNRNGNASAVQTICNVVRILVLTVVYQLPVRRL